MNPMDGTSCRLTLNKSVSKRDILFLQIIDPLAEEAILAAKPA